jgi:gamma-glutamylcyclotransferase (GGCT)/AIG2-like uncharacterized protein YtfP
VVDRESVQRLDVTECVDDGLYERREIDLKGPFGRVEAYFYLRDVDHLADIGTDWRTR